jgi:hypothetical protein
MTDDESSGIDISTVSLELAGCLLKLARARDHLDNLKARIEAFREPKPYRLIRETQTETDGYSDDVFRVEVLRTPPLDWSLVIGELLYNVHSSLDHLANRLADRHGSSQRVTFPIFKNRSKFWRKDKDGSWNGRSGAARLMLMPPDVHRLVEEVQPYQRGDDAPSHPLWLLHELSNADKHQALHIVGSAVTGTKLWANPSQDVMVEHRWVNLGPFNDGDEIGCVRCWVTGPNPKATVKANFATAEAFSEPGPAAGQNVANVLRDIVIYVLKDVFMERFAPYFG